MGNLRVSLVPRSQVSPQYLQHKDQNGMHNRLWIVVLHEADQGPGECLRLIRISHQMLQVVYYWAQPVLKTKHQETEEQNWRECGMSQNPKSPHAAEWTNETACNPIQSDPTTLTTPWYLGLVRSPNKPIQKHHCQQRCFKQNVFDNIRLEPPRVSRSSLVTNLLRHIMWSLLMFNLLH